MGLDIKTFCTVADLRNCIDECDDQLQKNEAIRCLEKADDADVLWTAPGSYSGLHVVRTQYARLKGWPIDERSNRYISGGPAEKSHLINHCDAEGYYLPWDFPEPQWIDTGRGHALAVGSSNRLLSEVMELLSVKEQWPEGFQYRWDAVFLAAFASVLMDAPIQFT